MHPQGLGRGIERRCDAGRRRQAQQGAVPEQIPQPVGEGLTLRLGVLGQGRRQVERPSEAFAHLGSEFRLGLVDPGPVNRADLGRL